MIVRGIKFIHFLLIGMITVFLLALAYLWLVKENLFASGIFYEYVFFLLTGVLFYSSAFFFKPSNKANLSLLTISILFVVYFSECFLLFFESGKKDASDNFDKRTRLEVLMDLRKSGVDAWTTMYPGQWIMTEGHKSFKGRIFPLAGISKKKSIMCNESGEYVIFESDEHGFNNPRGLHNKGLVDIVLVGDSFVEGQCVKSGSDISGQLRSYGYRTLNLGMGDSGPLIELAITKEYAEPLEPKVVLWFYFEGNDLNNFEREKNSILLTKYLEDTFTQNLVKRRSEIDAVLIHYFEKELQSKIKQEQLIFKFFKSQTFKVLSLFHLRQKFGFYRKTRKPTQSFFEVISNAKSRIESWEGRIYFIYVPELRRYTHNRDDKSYLNRGEILHRIKKSGIKTIDFHEVLSLEKTPTSFYTHNYGHLTPKGYGLLAKEIDRQLKSQFKSNLEG